jgi:hypothetical protein
VPILIDPIERAVEHVAIKIEALRIAELGIGHGLDLGGPVRRHEPCIVTGVVSGPLRLSNAVEGQAGAEAYNQRGVALVDARMRCRISALDPMTRFSD